MKLTKLQLRLAELKESMYAINDKAEAEGRSALTAEEDERFDALKKEYDGLYKRLLPKSEDEEQREIFIPTEFRLTAERTAAGKKLREILRERGEFTLELREDLRASTTSADIANVVPVYIKDFIEPLEKGLIFNKLGIKIETGLSGETKYPIMPYIEATIEDEAVALSDTTIKPGALTPHPRRVGIKCPLTGLANIMSDMRVYNWVIGAVTSAIARLLNRWMFMTLPVKSNVYGVFAYNKDNNAIIQKAFAGDTPTYAELLAMQGEVMSTGAINDGTYAYVMSAKMLAKLKATPIKANGGDKMIVTNDEIDGIPVFVTEEIECTEKNVYNENPKHVGFGRFTDVKVGEFGQMRLVIDPYTDSSKDITNVTVNAHWAVDVIRNGSFVIGTATA